MLDMPLFRPFSMIKCASNLSVHGEEGWRGRRRRTGAWNPDRTWEPDRV